MIEIRKALDENKFDEFYEKYIDVLGKRI